ncbi:MAG TPA: DUF2188 domain-containing protein [Thermoanaerobaculia bacterium]|jgi:hypothetical protein
MRFTEAERAEIIAEMRKLRAEGKGRVHVITSVRRGWAVFREGTEGKHKNFRTKEEAVSYARELSRRFQKDLVIHAWDGGLESLESPPPLTSGSSGQ